jgi:hypothetical protein
MSCCTRTASGVPVSALASRVALEDGWPCDVIEAVDVLVGQEHDLEVVDVISRLKWSPGHTENPLATYWPVGSLSVSVKLQRSAVFMSRRLALSSSSLSLVMEVLEFPSKLWPDMTVAMTRKLPSATSSWVAIALFSTSMLAPTGLVRAVYAHQRWSTRLIYVHDHALIVVRAGLRNVQLVLAAVS